MSSTTHPAEPRIYDDHGDDVMASDQFHRRRR